MRRCCSIVLLVLVIFLASPAAAALKVVAATPDLGALARDIGGADVSVTVLASDAQDPHYVDPRPSHIVALNQADLLVFNGAELEVGWLPALVVQSRNPRIQTGGDGHFEAAKHVKLRGAPTKVDRAQGDIHPAGNPHFSVDARAGAVLARALSVRMADLDGDRAQAYRQRGEALAVKLETFAIAERARFAGLPAERRQVVTYHKSLAYLLDWLDLGLVATVEPKPGIAPTPGHTAKVLKSMKAGSIPVLLQERHYPKATSQTLCKLAGAQLVVIDGQTRFAAGQSYLDHLKGVTNALYAALAP